MPSAAEVKTALKHFKSTHQLNEIHMVIKAPSSCGGAT